VRVPFQLVKQGTHLVDVDPWAQSHVARFDTERPCRVALLPPGETGPQTRIHGVPERPAGLARLGFQLGSNVLVEGQCCSHILMLPNRHHGVHGGNGCRAGYRGCPLRSPLITRPPAVSMQTAGHRSDDNWPGRVVIVNARRYVTLWTYPQDSAWRKFPLTSGRTGCPHATSANGKTYYWLTFSSKRSGTAQLFVTAVVLDSGSLTTYPAMYLWNQPPGDSNHTPSWDDYKIPPIVIQ
jgi:hypothetical protein